MSLLALVAVCLCGSVLVPLLARWSVTTMRPSSAVPVTAAASLAAALGSGAALSALAVFSLAGWGPVAREGGVSVGVLRALVPVPGLVGLVAVGVVALLAGNALIRGLSIAVAFGRSARLCRSLPGRSPVVFTDGEDIVTLAGFPGRIVVGTALFHRLEPGDQRIVLAHERSHLRRRHHWYVHLVDIAAAANPVLAPVRGIVRLGIERWADEDAACAGGVCDRDGTARALARVALLRQKARRTGARQARPLPAGTLAAAALQVSTRVGALLRPARPARTWGMAVLAVPAATALAAGLVALARIDGAIELAQVFAPPS